MNTDVFGERVRNKSTGCERVRISWSQLRPMYIACLPFLCQGFKWLFSGIRASDQYSESHGFESRLDPRIFISHSLSKNI